MGLFDKFAESIESARQNALAISRRNQLQAQEAQRAYDDTVELRSLLDNARPTMAPSTRPEALATDRAMNEYFPVRAAMAEQFPALTRPMDEQAPNYDKITFDFLRRRNPGEAQTFAQNVITQAQSIARGGDHEGAVNHVNNVLGTNMTYLGSKDNLMSIANGDGTHILYDISTGESQEVGTPKPITLGEGQTLFDPRSRLPIYSAPSRPVAVSPGGSLVNPQNGAPVFTAPPRKEKGFDTIDMGDRVKIVPRDGSAPYYERKNLTPAQAVRRTGTGGTGGGRRGDGGASGSNTAPKQQKLPAAMQQDLATTNELLDTLYLIKQSYKPEYVGMFDNAMGYLSGKTDIMADSEEQKLRALVQSQFNIQGKLRSGSAWTAPEIKRLSNELPEMSNGYTAFKAKLENSIQTLQRKRKRILETSRNTVIPGQPPGADDARPASNRPLPKF